MEQLWNATYGGSAVRYKVRRKLLSQNFLYNRTLIASLVRKSSIGKNDIVLEIGPGKGFITTELLEVSRKVIAVELDEKLVAHLYSIFNDLRLEIYHQDFLKFNLPSSPYKVFANLPFSIEGEIVRKLLDNYSPPVDCYLVVMKKLAIRLSGGPHENQFSLKHKPWFDFSIYHYFKRTDFIPSPNVDSVMWRITLKDAPLLPLEQRGYWERFIEIGFSNGLQVKQNLRKILTQKELNLLASKLKFSLKTKPGFLTLDQWLTLYKAIYING